MLLQFCLLKILSGYIWLKVVALSSVRAINTTMEPLLFSQVLTSSKDKQEFGINQDECLLDCYSFAFLLLDVEDGKELQLCFF